jgi:hypothetical protein
MASAVLILPVLLPAYLLLHSDYEHSGFIIRSSRVSRVSRSTFCRAMWLRHSPSPEHTHNLFLILIARISWQYRLNGFPFLVALSVNCFSYDWCLCLLAPVVPHWQVARPLVELRLDFDEDNEYFQVGDVPPGIVLHAHKIWRFELHCTIYWTNNAHIVKLSHVEIEIEDWQKVL